MTTLYLATDDGLIVITRTLDRWHSERPLKMRGVSCLAADPAVPERIFCGTHAQGTWRSDNAGRDWQRVFENLPHERITSLAVSSVEHVEGHGVVYLGTEPSALFRSVDGGKSWHECIGLIDLPSATEWSFPPRPQTHHVRWIGLDLHQAGRLYVAIEAGALVRSPDCGSTWWDRVPGGPYDTHQLITHPNAPGRLWSAAGDGFFESDDAGNSWRRAELGLRFHYCWSVAVDPVDPELAVLSAAPGPNQAHALESAESAIYRRTGHGAWQEVRSGLPGPRGIRAPVLSASPAEPGVFYAAGDAGLYRSSDAGATWRRLDVDWPEAHSRNRVHQLIALP